MTAASWEGPWGRSAVRRDGDRFVGDHETAEGTVAVDHTVEDSAVGGMGSVLVVRMPLEWGTRWTHADHNDGKGFLAEGHLTMTVQDVDTVALPDGDVEVHRIVLRRKDGRELPMWVDAEGRLVQVDWGGGNLMIRHPSSTVHLFRP